MFGGVVNYCHTLTRSKTRRGRADDWERPYTLWCGEVGKTYGAISPCLDLSGPMMHPVRELRDTRKAHHIKIAPALRLTCHHRTR